MKKLLISVGVVVLVSGATVSPIVSAFVGLAPMQPVTELPNGVLGVADGYLQAFIVPVGGSEAVLIDCGQDPEAKALKAKLAELKLGVKAIFLTHGHRDHVGGCKAFPDAALYGLEAERAVAEGAEASKGLITRLGKNDPALVRRFTRGLADGELVEVGATKVQAFAIPGHTVGSAAFLANEVLFLGDAVTAQSDGNLRNTPWVFSDDQAQCRASVQGLARRLASSGAPVKALALSHSGPSFGVEALSRF